MDTQRLPSKAAKTVALAHELGHCETGSFYNEKNPLDIKGKHEYRANRWAVQAVIPWEDLLGAFERGIFEIWELSEYFDVTEDFMRIVFDIYRRQGKI